MASVKSLVLSFFFMSISCFIDSVSLLTPWNGPPRHPKLSSEIQAFTRVTNNFHSLNPVISFSDCILLKPTAILDVGTLVLPWLLRWHQWDSSAPTLGLPLGSSPFNVDSELDQSLLPHCCHSSSSPLPPPLDHCSPALLGSPLPPCPTTVHFHTIVGDLFKL